MNFEVKFSESDLSLEPNFREIQRVSDGGYERGYEAGYAKANAVITALIDGNPVSLYNDAATSVKPYCFYQHSGITSISLPNVTECGNYAFAQCSKLSSLSLPKLQTCGQHAFSYAGMQEADFPELLIVPVHAMAYCSALKNLTLKKATTLKQMCCRQSSNLTFVDLGAVELMENGCFYYCKKLETLIIRTQSVCTLTNANTLSATLIAEGDGFIYVPDALVDSYKADSIWSTYAAQIKPISELEGET